MLQVRIEAKEMLSFQCKCPLIYFLITISIPPTTRNRPIGITQVVDWPVLDV